MIGLAPHTGLIFDKISQLECIKPYILVGGTALSLQIGKRQSEDLDFMKWRTTKTEKLHTKNLYAMLTNGSRFAVDTNFVQLHPIYSVSVTDIEQLIREKMAK